MSREEVKALREAVSKTGSESNPRLWFQLARALHACGDHEEAYRVVTRAISAIQLAVSGGSFEEVASAAAAATPSSSSSTPMSLKRASTLIAPSPVSFPLLNIKRTPSLVASDSGSGSSSGAAVAAISNDASWATLAGLLSDDAVGCLPSGECRSQAETVQTLLLAATLCLDHLNKVGGRHCVVI